MCVRCCIHPKIGSNKTAVRKFKSNLPCYSDENLAHYTRNSFKPVSAAHSGTVRVSKRSGPTVATSRV